MNGSEMLIDSTIPPTLKIDLFPSAGCFGNIFSIVGLAMNKRMPLISSQADNSGSSKQINGHLSFTRLLIALAVFDFLYLFIGIAIFGLPVLSQGGHPHSLLTI